MGSWLKSEMLELTNLQSKDNKINTCSPCDVNFGTKVLSQNNKHVKFSVYSVNCQLSDFCQVVSNIEAPNIVVVGYNLHKQLDLVDTLELIYYVDHLWPNTMLVLVGNEYQTHTSVQTGNSNHMLNIKQTSYQQGKELALSLNNIPFFVISNKPSIDTMFGYFADYVIASVTNQSSLESTTVVTESRY